jgi:DNA-binding response OmpR family regulator
MPVRAMILLIEGKRSNHPSFSLGLTKKGFEVHSVSSGNAALAFLEQHSPHIILIDAASMRTSGKRICQSIREHKPNLPIMAIVNKEQSEGKLDADVILVQPFTLQKLLNRLRPLLPAENKNVLVAGPLNLDTEQRWVRYHNRQISLTPRMVTLLKVLMQHPGEVIDREELFKLVWDTAYTGDTRTLDVHISWLRQALEEDPRHPRFVKTVRGVGYRLDIEPEPMPSRH